MIPRTKPSLHTTSWQNELAQAVKDPTELLKILELNPELLPAANQAAKTFPLRVPRSFIARMRKGDPQDPLLLQVLPLHDELITSPGFYADPVGDLTSMATPGVLHKYHGRALFITTGACAVHCRYCFRRHFPYSGAHAGSSQWSHAIDYIKQNSSITEIILSGGDPLSLHDNRLASLLAMLDAIPHLQRLRIHTRLPIVIPQRVTTSLINALTGLRLTPVVVVHANHANEIDHTVSKALTTLKTAGVLLLNQSVLLKGVNNSSTALVDLSEALFAAGVLPYYLHLLDRVQGAGHYEVDDPQARQIHHQLAQKLPGYLVPRLVREQSGAPYKIPQ
jgi:EF-P beta-lysylation protein EpmB